MTLHKEQESSNFCQKGTCINDAKSRGGGHFVDRITKGLGQMSVTEGEEWAINHPNLCDVIYEWSITC